MHDPEKSDSGIVAMKPMNKAGRPAAELAEPRPGTKGNADQQSTHRTQSRARVTQALDCVRKAARQRKKEQFTSLLHHMDVDLLRTAFYALKRKAAPGLDGMMWADYEADLERRLEDLHGRVHRGAYRPRPSRRTYIPKADGKQRPLAIAALEDKIVQGATVMLLNAIYEGDFCGFSYGFRPGRGPHDALDALSTAIKIRKVNWILDADIQNFFGAVSQDWLVRYLEHRIGDKRITHLIQKWLRAGILENGVVTVDDRGTGQGSVISPLLANIYLHYCFDLWAERWRRHEARGDMIVVRYADDLVAGTDDSIRPRATTTPTFSLAWKGASTDGKPTFAEAMLNEEFAPKPGLVAEAAQFPGSTPCLHSHRISAPLNSLTLWSSVTVTKFLRFARVEQAQEAKRARARNPTVSKSEIDHHFAADPLGELCNLDEDLLQFWVLGKKRLRLLVGRRIGVRHDYEPIALIWTGLDDIYVPPFLLGRCGAKLTIR